MVTPQPFSELSFSSKNNFVINMLFLLILVIAVFAGYSLQKGDLFGKAVTRTSAVSSVPVFDTPLFIASTSIGSTFITNLASEISARGYTSPANSIIGYVSSQQFTLLPLTRWKSSVRDEYRYTIDTSVPVGFVKEKILGYIPAQSSSLLSGKNVPLLEISQGGEKTIYFPDNPTALSKVGITIDKTQYDLTPLGYIRDTSPDVGFLQSLSSIKISSNTYGSQYITYDNQGANPSITHYARRIPLTYTAGSTPVKSITFVVRPTPLPVSSKDFYLRLWGFWPVHDSVHWNMTASKDPTGYVLVGIANQPEIGAGMVSASDQTFKFTLTYGPNGNSAIPSGVLGGVIVEDGALSTASSTFLLPEPSIEIVSASATIAGDSNNYPVSLVGGVININIPFVRADSKIKKPYLYSTSVPIGITTNSLTLGYLSTIQQCAPQLLETKCDVNNVVEITKNLDCTITSAIKQACTAQQQCLSNVCKDIYSCTDTDGGKVLTVAGSITTKSPADSGTVRPDACSSDTVVTEQSCLACSSADSCVGTKGLTENLACPAGTFCQTGACIKECAEGFVSSGKLQCSGTNVEQEYQLRDCSVIFKTKQQCSELCSNGVCVLSATCTDTDAGKDLSNIGVSETKSSKNLLVANGSDSCSSDKNVKEYFCASCLQADVCVGSITKNETIACSSGTFCSAGRCVTECKDEDLNIFQCSGAVRQIQHQSRDCSLSWKSLETCSDACVSGSCVSTLSCVDSDNGVNLSVKGIATETVIKSGVKNVFADVCSSDKIVNEYSCASCSSSDGCTGSRVLAQNLSCPSQTFCNDGKCISECSVASTNKYQCVGKVLQRENMNRDCSKSWTDEAVCASVCDSSIPGCTSLSVCVDTDGLNTSISGNVTVTFTNASTGNASSFVVGDSCASTTVVNELSCVQCSAPSLCSGTTSNVTAIPCASGFVCEFGRCIVPQPLVFDFLLANVTSVPTMNSAVITWDTNVTTGWTLHFGPSVSSLSGVLQSSIEEFSHRSELSALSSGTTYTYQLSACSINLSLCKNYTFSFATLQPAPAPVVTPPSSSTIERTTIIKEREVIQNNTYIEKIEKQGGNGVVNVNQTVVVQQTVSSPKQSEQSEVPVQEKPAPVPPVSLNTSFLWTVLWISLALLLLVLLLMLFVWYNNRRKIIEQLKAAIRLNLAKGYTFEEIITALVTAGWPKLLVEKAGIEVKRDIDAENKKLEQKRKFEQALKH